MNDRLQDRLLVLDPVQPSEPRMLSACTPSARHRIRLSARPAAVAALLLLLVGALAVLLRSPVNYAAQDREAIASATSPAHPAGTDDLGRDRLVRLAAALLLGMAGAVAAAALAAALAAAVGAAAAFAPAPVGAALLYGCDLLLTLPWLFLLITVRASLPLTLAPAVSAAVTFLLLGLLGWPAFARVTHAGAARIRASEWLLYARASGLPAGRIARRHVLPHLRPLVLTQFLLSVPAFLVAEANLGAIGLGVADPLPSWGSLLLELSRSGAAPAASVWMLLLPVILLVLVLLLLETLTGEASP